MHTRHAKTAPSRFDPQLRAALSLPVPRGRASALGVPGLRGGANLPAEAGRARQDHVHLGHQHHHLRSLHEAQPVVHAHTQTALQDLQRAAVQRIAPLGTHTAQSVPAPKGRGSRGQDKQTEEAIPGISGSEGAQRKRVQADARQIRPREPLAFRHFRGSCGFSHTAWSSQGSPSRHPLPVGVGESANSCSGFHG